MPPYFTAHLRTPSCSEDWKGKEPKETNYYASSMHKRTSFMTRSQALLF